MTDREAIRIIDRMIITDHTEPKKGEQDENG